MANVKKKWVVFKSGTKIPASVMGTAKDFRAEVGVPVQVPADYADHVVGDGFAVHSDATAKPAPKKGAALSGEAKARILSLEQNLEAANSALSLSKVEVERLTGDLQLSTDSLDRVLAALESKSNALDGANALLRQAAFDQAQLAVTGAQAALEAVEGTDAATGARVALVAAQNALAALEG